MRIISGIARGRKILSPESMVTRPTLDRIKESIFDIIQNKVPNAVVMDMFSGTGSLGLEAASRGAQKCYLVDRDNITFSLLSENIKNLKFEDICQCFKGDTYSIIEKLGKENIKFDLIFIDPPYAKGMISPAVKIIHENNLLNEDGLIVCKIDSNEEIYEGYENILIFDKRKYGNTTVLFYKQKEDQA